MSMEKMVTCAEEAKKAFVTADHLVYVTFPLLNDQKLLATIAEKLHVALNKGMQAVLEYDYLYKRIQFVPNDFEGRMTLFKQYALRRYHFNPECLTLMTDLNEIVNRRKESPMEFVRRDRFVIASSDFRLKTITVDKMKQYAQHTKTFISKVAEIIQASDRRLDG